MGMEAKTLKYQAKFKVKLSLKASGHVLLRLLESSKEMKPLWAKATLHCTFTCNGAGTALVLKTSLYNLV